jgi:hypothetical protein
LFGLYGIAGFLLASSDQATLVYRTEQLVIVNPLSGLFGPSLSATCHHDLSPSLSLSLSSRCSLLDSKALGACVPRTLLIYHHQHHLPLLYPTSSLFNILYLSWLVKPCGPAIVLLLSVDLAE